MMLGLFAEVLSLINSQLFSELELLLVSKHICGNFIWFKHLSRWEDTRRSYNIILRRGPTIPVWIYTTRVLSTPNVAYPQLTLCISCGLHLTVPSLGQGLCSVWPFLPSGIGVQIRCEQMIIINQTRYQIKFLCSWYEVYAIYESTDVIYKVYFFHQILVFLLFLPVHMLPNYPCKYEYAGSVANCILSNSIVL